MQSLSPLISSVSDETALRDTQVDEYYSDISPENFEAADIALIQNPYPGLRPFKTTESIVFYGREGISSELITRLAACRFLSVLGSSGTGKSSLVRAGLLPVLRTLPGKNGEWKVAICRPGKNPFGNLARAIFSAKIITQYNEMEIWKILSSSSYGYQEIYNLTNASDTYNTLIIIDQFEELFRYRNDHGLSGRNDAALFVKMLIETSQNEKLKTYVMITMRSEYLGDCVQLPQLVDAINNGQYLVPRLKPRQLIDVIAEPAIFSGATVEAGFASKLIGEIGDNMDQLPVLQHVLRRAYEIAEKNPVDGNNVTVRYKDYVAVGKMESALDKHGEEVFGSLTTKQQEYCKILFQSITDRTTDGRGIRRPLPFSTLLDICKEKEGNNRSKNEIRNDLEMVINSFRKDTVNFLMPPPHVQLTNDLEIDISHESLMRIWKVLQLWMDEEAQDASLLDELLQLDKNDYIVRKGKLITYKEWLHRKKPGIAWAALYRKYDSADKDFDQKFIDAISLLDKSRKAHNKRRITLIGLIATIFLLGMGAAFLIALKNNQLKSNNDLLKAVNVKLANQQNELESKNVLLMAREQDLVNKNKIITAQKNNLSKEISEKQNALISLGLVKREAENNFNNTLKLNLKLNKAMQILNQKQDSLIDIYTAGNKLKNFALAIKHSEKSLAIPTYDLKRENIKAHLALIAYQLYQQSDEEENKRLQPQIYSALYSALRSKINDDTFIITSDKKGTDYLAYAVLSNFQEKRSMVYLTAEDKKFYSFDLENRKANQPKDLGIGNKLVGVEASANGRWIALNTLSKKLLLINNDNGQQETINLSGIIKTSKFSVDNSSLYMYTKDSVITIIQLADKKKSSQKINFKIEDIALSNSYVYGLAANGDVIKWTIKNIRLDPDTILGPNKEKLSRGTVISCKPNDSLIVWGNENGQVFYIKNDVQKAQYLTRFGGPVTSIAFNHSYNLMAVASYDKTVQVFNLLNLQSEVPLILNNNEGPVTSLFFQRNKAGKEKLMAVMSRGLIREYPMDAETLACRLYAIYKDKRPPEEEWSRYIDKAVEDKKVELICK